MGLIQYYHITCKPVNQAIYIFITVPIVFFCNLVSIKCIIALLLLYYTSWLVRKVKVLGYWSLFSCITERIETIINSLTINHIVIKILTITIIVTKIILITKASDASDSDYNNKQKIYVFAVQC